MTLFENNGRTQHTARLADAAPPAFEAYPHSNVVPLDLHRPARRVIESAPTDKGIEAAFRIAPRSDSRKTDSRRLLLTMIVVSAACHAGAIAASLRQSAEEFGTLADKTDTFSLSMEQSIVLESISTESVQMAAAAAASQAGSVQAVESKPQERADAESDPVRDDPPPKPVKVADVAPTALAPTDDPLPVIHGGGAPQAVSEFKADQIADKQVEEMPEAVETKEDAPEKAKRKKKDEKEKKTPQQESHQQVAGSATSRSNASEASLSGRVSASRGNALSYGAMVRAQLMHNKPTGNGLQGTVLISFGIAPDGKLRYLKLSQSCGNPTLDDAALSAVRNSAPFDEPPSDLSPTDLAYVIPFYFH